MATSRFLVVEIVLRYEDRRLCRGAELEGGVRSGLLPKQTAISGTRVVRRVALGDTYEVDENEGRMRSRE